MAESIRINFGKPMPLFPLEGVVLLPHAVLPLHIFESRYRQMVNDCLDQAGQIAVATRARPGALNGPDASEEDETEIALRPAVCVGQIIQHEALDDGRHNILLHGVCRARIVGVEEPTEEREYSLAELSPIEPMQSQPPPMVELREELRQMLQRPRLSRMRSVETVSEWFDRSDIPTHALLELIGFTLVKSNEVKYRLLEEADPSRRADLIKRELLGLDRLFSRAERQSHGSWPKGMSWN